MSGWSIPNQARIRATNERAAKLGAAMAYARCLKEAAYIADIPERSARRLRQRIG